MPSPFPVGIPGDPFTDRADEVAHVLRAMRSRGRLVVYGERRLGKTSILKRAAARLEHEGGVALYVDVWATADEAGLYRAVLEALPRSWLLGTRVQGLLRRLGSSVSLSVGRDGSPRLSFDPALRQESDTLADLLRRIDEVAGETDTPVVLILDEFQKLQDRSGLTPAGLRGLAQECPHLGWILSGSALGMITGLLGPREPFYGWPVLEVGPMDPGHLASWVASVLAEHGLHLDGAGAAALVEAAGGITSYVLELANALHGQELESGPQAALGPDAVARVRRRLALARDERYEDLWDRQHETGRKILAALARGMTEITGEEARRRFGLPPSNQVAYHLRRMQEDGVLRSDRRTLQDPFFQAWIQEKVPAREYPGA